MLRKQLLLISLFAPLSVHALSLSGGLGFGSTTMTNEISQTEKPLVQVYTVEYLQHSSLSLGAEHMRSLTSSFASSASATGLLGRYYFNSAPTPRISADEATGDAPLSRGYSFFAGIGAGLAQSSTLPELGKTSNVAGVYASPRIGFDYQYSRHVGFRAEAIYATSIVGTGHLTMMSVGGGIYYTFGG